MSKLTFRLVFVTLLACAFAGFGVVSHVKAQSETHHTRKPSSSSRRHRKGKGKGKGKAPRNLTRKLDQVRKNREKVTEQIRATNRQVKKVKVDLNVVDSQLDHLERRLDVTTAELAVDRRRQRELTKLLADDQVQLGKQSEDVRHRIRQMYMQGNAPAVSVLLGTSNSGDLASRAYFVERVVQADSNALRAYKDLVTRISRQKAEADDVLARIKRRERDQREQQGELQDTRAAKADALTDLESKKDQLLAVLRQLAEDEASVQREILAAISRGGGSSSPRKFTGRFQIPVQGRLGSAFGMRFHPVLHEMKMHSGQDFPAPTGTPITAAANGVVVSARYMRGYGNCIILNHGGGIATVYAHCSRMMVSVGDQVTRGQHIGNVGSTGMTTGPHLHFEVQVNGHAVNPLGWL
jgi:murein DD-endopeptidase MepM/ murein hydrolase activator NlpD